MSFRIVTIGVLCGLFLFGAGKAGADILVNDQFTTDGALNGMIPSPGPGLAWNAGSATGINAVQVTSGEVALIQTDGGTNGEDVANVFSDRAANAPTYSRFDFRLPSADNGTLAIDPDVIGEGAYFISLRGTSASMSLRARFGVLAPAGATGFRAAINADNSNLADGASWPDDLAFDITYRAIISYDAGLGESRLWINPLNEASSSVADPGAAGTVINRVIVRQNDDYAGKQLIDNLVVATTFAEALSGGASGNFLPADFNEDGNVDGADLEDWKADFSTLTGADADDDGDSDGADFLLWQHQVGQPPPPGVTAVTAIPEPAAGVLAGVGLAVLAFGRCRTCSGSKPRHLA